MCCFSQRVVSVSATNIFARPAEAGRQFLVYSMNLNAEKELAMILPLPVKAGTGVTFIDFSGYPDFFADLLKGFPERPPPRSLRNTKSEAVAAAAVLEVVRVGNFEASFVPTLKDFSRLDERFRIDDTVWKKLPAYQDYGFAVFKLKSGEAKVHPMAFSFPRRNPRSLFFPTVHIHDGELHSKAEFDHTLYCQPTEMEQLVIREWRESEGNASKFIKVSKSQGVVAPAQHCYQKILRGELPNRDTHVLVET